MFQLLTNTEARIGLPMTFSALPATDSVLARCTFDPFRNEPQIQLRRGWQDVDVAHELMHMRMELLRDLEKFVGPSAYKKTGKNHYILPFPTDSP